VPRVRSPIKGDLYRGSLLNFWCVRPGEVQINAHISHLFLAVLESLKAISAEVLTPNFSAIRAL